MEPTQNNGTEPTAHNEVSPASAVGGGREILKTVLYVGGIEDGVSEEELKETIGQAAPAQSVKILKDKNKAGYNYAFVEFADETEAKLALDQLNGTVVKSSPIRINYAYQLATFNTMHKSEEPVFNIFVGDLLPDVDDEALHQAFSHFTTLKEAHVMWDMQTSRSRGYGFVTFGTADDAEQALLTMNGESINGRSIRCNWASHKQNRQRSRPGPRAELPGVPPRNFYTPEQLAPPAYDMVLRQTPLWQTTVYLGNIAHFTHEDELIPLLQNFGYIVGFKLYAEKGCAFVTYDTHERAALAIVQLGGFRFNGRPLKCGWGKTKPRWQ